jgi:polyhydroxybutyrate depolymerase
VPLLFALHCDEGPPRASTEGAAEHAVVAEAPASLALSASSAVASGAAGAPLPSSEASGAAGGGAATPAPSQPQPGDELGLYVPAAGGTQRLPLLIFLHGLGGSGAELSRYLRLTEFAELRGFGFMAPDGDMDFGGRRYWNATQSCCDFDRRQPDHVARLRALIEKARKHSRVDAKRIYLIGYSNGGFLAHRAGCELTRSLAGIVSVAGAGPGETEPCAPGGALSALQIHGTRDPIVAFDGGYLFADRRFPPHPSATASIERWARNAGCEEQSKRTGGLDLDPLLPGGETEVLAYSGCRGARVELWRIVGGGHSSGLSPFSLDAIWRFLEKLGADN